MKLKIEVPGRAKENLDEIGGDQNSSPILGKLE